MKQKIIKNKKKCRNKGILKQSELMVISSNNRGLIFPQLPPHPRKSHLLYVYVCVCVDRTLKKVGVILIIGVTLAKIGLISGCCMSMYINKLQ